MSFESVWNTVPVILFSNKKLGCILTSMFKTDFQCDPTNENLSFDLNRIPSGPENYPDSNQVLASYINWFLSFLSNALWKSFYPITEAKRNTNSKKENQIRDLTLNQQFEELERPLIGLHSGSARYTTISLTTWPTVFLEVRPVTVASTSLLLPGAAEYGALKVTEKKLFRSLRTVMEVRRRRATYFRRSLTFMSNRSVFPVL